MGPIKRIMLLCSGGMSTSMLAARMCGAAEALGVACKIWSSSEAESRRYLDEVDVILLGPQVRYLRARVEKAIGTRPVRVDVIDPMAYGRMEGEKVLKLALQLAE